MPLSNSLSEIIKPLPWDGNPDHPKDPEGKAVIKPGLYSLPDRSLYPKTAGVSKSRLSNFDRSPAYDQATREHPEWFPATVDQVRGNMLDTLLFDPAGFARYFLTPEGFRNQGAKNQAKMKEWQEKYGPEYVIHDSKAKAAYRRVETIAKKIRERGYLDIALSDGYPHVAVYWKDPTTGMMCKAELDYLREAPGTAPDGSGLLITDLKTVRNASASAFERSYGSFAYDVQAAFFCDGVYEQTGIEPDFLFAVAETDPPYEPAEYLPDPEDLAEARTHYQILMRYIVWCRANKTYPGYPTMRTIHRPRFARRLSEDSINSFFKQRGIDL